MSAQWYTKDFAEINAPTCTLAIGSTRTLSLFGKDLAQTGLNNSVIIEFRVANVDEQYEKIKDLLSEIIQEPTTMPWGNRSLMFRDPDGNLINFFTPVTKDAIKKFS
ncbi:MAG: VOC family protein [Pedobacter sp.]|nr:VOC family protein [Pedobacter sp.]